MTEDQTITITLDADQYRDLLGVLDIGLLVKETILGARKGDAEAREELADLASLEKVLLESAVGTDAENLVQDAGKRLLPSDDVMDETEETVDEYVEDQFWLELSDRLGQRDFLENVSEESLEDVDAEEVALQDGVREYYAKYDKEFDRYGLDRLRVDGK